MLCVVSVTEASETSQEADVSKDNGLKSVVHSWLSTGQETKDAVSTRGATIVPPSVPPSEAALLQWLRAAEPPRYHNHVGCMVKTICYASVKVIEDLLAFDPGVVIEYGSFLGETTAAIAQALARMATVSSSERPTYIVAIDTWKQHTYYMNMFTQTMQWESPPGLVQALASADPAPSLPAAFYQFKVNMDAIPEARDRVMPLPLLISDTIERARTLALNISQRPKLVYVNPSEHGLRHVLPHLWKLLTCGGTMAGHGYHLPTVQPVIDEFAARTGVALEAKVVHAPGTKYENIHLPFSHETMAQQLRSNFSWWALRGKRCSNGNNKDVV